MSRVMLCHCQGAEEEALLQDDLSFVTCDGSEEMIAEVTLQPPDVVVYEVRPDSESDLAVLRLLRRLAPRVPLVVVGGGSSPAWDVPSDLEPLYRSPLPVEEGELREAVASALASCGDVS
jgi:DNA-binding NtrC family response regulator